jgi:hypothetical protein
MTERTPEDDITAIGLIEMNETRDYLERGRAFSGREDVELLDLWVASFEKLFAMRGPQLKLMVDDIQAELRLRKIELPADRVSAILKETTAEYDAHPDRWDDLDRKLDEVLKDSKKPKN